MLSFVKIGRVFLNVSRYCVFDFRKFCRVFEVTGNVMTFSI